LSLDTPQKRSSVFQLPGIMTAPYPSGAITKSDRQQISDIYCGISVSTGLPISQTYWFKGKASGNAWAIGGSQASSWKVSGSLASSYAKGKGNASNWVVERQESNDWEKENEVTDGN
jgi:hypothetical protein